MTTSRERESILNEYGAWVEEKTLGGIDTSVEAFLAEFEAHENAETLEALTILAQVDDAATFRYKARSILGIQEALDEH
jgi:hypothetical protein